jgi:hypothetical protein
MTHVAIFLAGLTAGIILAGLFEQRAVREVLSLRTFLRAELQKLATKL